MDPVRLGLYVKKMSMEKKNVLSNVRLLARGLNSVIFFIGYADVELLPHVDHSLGHLTATMQAMHAFVTWLRILPVLPVRDAKSMAQHLETIDADAGTIHRVAQEDNV